MTTASGNARRNGRAEISDVGEAQRQALARAVAAGLSDGEWRVFACVLSLVTSWTRLEDTVYRRQVADCAKVSERQASRCLDRLAAYSVIVWKPAKGAGRKSRLGLPVVEKRDTPREKTRHASRENETRSMSHSTRRKQDEEKASRGETTARARRTSAPRAMVLGRLGKDLRRAVEEAVAYLENECDCTDERTHITT
jgi:hypothetical protein